MAITMKVYGRRNASATIESGEAVLSVREDMALSTGHAQLHATTNATLDDAIDIGARIDRTINLKYTKNRGGLKRRCGLGKH
jgi:hypothetical protein